MFWILIHNYLKMWTQQKLSIFSNRRALKGRRKYSVWWENWVIWKGTVTIRNHPAILLYHFTMRNRNVTMRNRKVSKRDDCAIKEFIINEDQKEKKATEPNPWTASYKWQGLINKPHGSGWSQRKRRLLSLGYVVPDTYSIWHTWSQSVL